MTTIYFCWLLLGPESDIDAYQLVAIEPPAAERPFYRALVRMHECRRSSHILT